MFKEMDDYALKKQAEGNKGEPYTLKENHCGTFARDVLSQDTELNEKMPEIKNYSRPNGIINDFLKVFEGIFYPFEEKNK